MNRSLLRYTLFAFPLLLSACHGTHYTYYFGHVAQGRSEALTTQSQAPTSIDAATEMELPQTLSPRDFEMVKIPVEDQRSVRHKMRKQLDRPNSHLGDLLTASSDPRFIQPIKISTKDQIGKAQFKVTGKMVLGFLIVVLGAVLLVVGGVIEILIGAVLLVFGSYLMVPDKSAPKSDSKAKSPSGAGSYTDVIHLKNGSVVRGTITEQTSTNLKVRTLDGNSFDYKMDDIAKILKEKKP
jgi:hypothetical protein